MLRSSTGGLPRGSCHGSGRAGRGAAGPGPAAEGVPSALDDAGRAAVNELLTRIGRHVAGVLPLLRGDLLAAERVLGAAK